MWCLASPQGDSFQASGLSALRKSLSAAEEDVARKQLEMEELRAQLSTPSLDSDEAIRWFVALHPQIPPFSTRLLTSRLVSLLKVQVGALSKFLHTRQPGASEWMTTRSDVDHLIRYSPLPSLFSLNKSCIARIQVDSVLG